MKTAIKNQLLEELDRKINQYVYNNKLFAGGCCYSAYVLTKYLKQLGVKYRITLFQEADILNETNFHKAINGFGVAHVAVEVRYKRRKCYIGTCDGVYRSFEWGNISYKVRSYKGMDPEVLLDAYKNNIWNWMYDKHCNGPLMRDIKKIAEKYMK